MRLQIWQIKCVKTENVPADDKFTIYDRRNMYKGIDDGYKLQNFSADCQISLHVQAKLFSTSWLTSGSGLPFLCAVMCTSSP